MSEVSHGMASGRAIAAGCSLSCTPVEQPFIAMECLDGATLKYVIGDKPMEAETVLDLAIQIVAALDAAHARGIIRAFAAVIAGRVPGQVVQFPGFDVENLQVFCDCLAENRLKRSSQISPRLYHASVAIPNNCLDSPLIIVRRWGAL